MHARQDQPEWVYLDSGASVLVRGIKSPTALQRMKKLPQSVRRAMTGGAGAWNDRTWRAYCDFLAETILCGWDAIEVGGERVEFTRDRAAEFLRTNYDFHWLVLEAARGDLTPEVATNG